MAQPLFFARLLPSTMALKFTGNSQENAILLGAGSVGFLWWCGEMFQGIADFTNSRENLVVVVVVVVVVVPDPKNALKHKMRCCASLEPLKFSC